MRRPPAYEWAVLYEDGDPVPGDPDAIVELGQALRDTADAIQREAGEIQTLASVESWQSKAADRFRDVAGDAAAQLRKAYHRYDVASRAMGTYVDDGSDANWASGLERAQQMAAKALRDAQAADAEHRAAQAHLNQLPSDTASTDPTATSLRKRQEAATGALAQAQAALQAAKEARDTAAKIAAERIHRAITHDGMHDSTLDKFDAGVGSVASSIGDFAENTGENILSGFASFGNAMIHDPRAFDEAVGGLGLAALGTGGAALGVGLDLSGVGTAPGLAITAASAAGIVGGLGIADSGLTALTRDAQGPDHVSISTDGAGGGGDWDPSAEPDRTQPSRQPDPNAKPGGRPTHIGEKNDPDTKRSLQRENESADILAKAGYDVEQNPNVPGDKNPDYRIEGKIFDNVAPVSDRPRNTADRIMRKVLDGQTDRIVVNLADSPLDASELSTQLHDWPISGLKEVIAIDRQGNILHIYP